MFVSGNSYGIVCVLPTPLLCALPPISVGKVKHLLEPEVLFGTHRLLDEATDQFIEADTVFRRIAASPLKQAVVQTNRHVCHSPSVRGSCVIGVWLFGIVLTQGGQGLDSWGCQDTSPTIRMAIRRGISGYRSPNSVAASLLFWLDW